MRWDVGPVGTVGVAPDGCSPNLTLRQHLMFVYTKRAIDNNLAHFFRSISKKKYQLRWHRGLTVLHGT